MRAFLLLFCLQVGIALAQQPTFIATLDHDTVGIEDLVSVTFTLLDGDARQVEPFFDDQWVAVVGGPSVSSHMSVVNGTVSRKKTWIYTLRPRQLADFADIGYAAVTINGEIIESNHVALTVVEGSYILPQPVQTQMDDFFNRPFPQFSFPDFWGMPQQSPRQQEKPKRPTYRL
jgi:hypothetical protein